MTNKPTLTLKNFQKKDINSQQKDNSISTESTANKNFTADNNQETTDLTVIKQVKKVIPLKNSKKKPLLSDDDYLSILQYLQKHHPKCFPPEESLVPLALGIHHQIFAIPDMPFSRMKIRRALKRYTSWRQYRKELVIDKSRFNLDGTPASKILKEEINWTAWKELRQAKRKNANHDSLVKKVMENPVAAAEFLDEFLPSEFKELLDLNTLQVEKESYVEDSLKTRFSDIVYSVKTKSEPDSETETAFIYTLLEHQSLTIGLLFVY